METLLEAASPVQTNTDSPRTELRTNHPAGRQLANAVSFQFTQLQTPNFKNGKGHISLGFCILIYHVLTNVFLRQCSVPHLLG